MRWPFRRKREETDLRIFRDPKTGELTLRLHGDVGWPADEARVPMIQIAVTLNTRLTESAARQLRDHINTFLPPQNSE
jgi:hypothetical protein